jgi:hypothetical protein
VSIVASVKVYDGVVLAADSATTIQSVINGQITVVKSYQHANKLFQIGKLPIGVLIYGLGNIGNRSIESFVLEFSKLKELELTSDKSVEEIAILFKDFIKEFYDKEFSALVIEKQPVLGFYFAGYSDGDSLANEWEVVFPSNIIPKKVRDDSACGASWRGIADPFARIYNGVDNKIINELIIKYKLDVNEVTEISNKYRTSVIYNGMPVQDAIDFVKYILSTTIGYTKFQIGIQSCSDPIDIIVITKGSGYQEIQMKELK